MKLSLCLICKNGDAGELESLPQLFDSVVSHVDETCVTVTIKEEGDVVHPRLMDILERYNVNISTFVWVDDFSEARNFNFNQARHELVIWLDADDLLVNGERLKEVVKRFEEKDSLDSVWLQYHYDHDKDGNCVCVFPRERIVRRKIHTWKGVLHENCICHYQTDGDMFPSEYMHVRHQVRHDKLKEKALRNLVVIQNAYAGDREKPVEKRDPRVIYDYGRSMAAIGRFEEAQSLFLEFLPMTGSVSDAYDAMMRIADCQIHLNRISDAIETCFLAIRRRWDLPEAYYLLAQIAYSDEKWDECLHWLSAAEDKKPPAGAIPMNPLRYTTRPMRLAAKCYFAKDPDPKDPERYARRALYLIEKVLDKTPSDKYAVSMKKQIQKYLSHIQVESGLLKTVDFLRGYGEHDKVKGLLANLPEAVKDHPYFVKLKGELFPESHDKRLVIYCHAGFETWGPEKVETGVGGSEEAVIHMSRHLSDLGWSVEVYCEREQSQKYGNVWWKPFWMFDRRKHCDVFIAWRSPAYVNFSPPDSLCVLWLHDKAKISDYPLKVINRVDRIFVLSKHHRDDLPEIPDEKFYVTRNGIEAGQFYGGAENNPRKFIYASSPDRGLDTLLFSGWKTIAGRLPEAELDVYYGFTRNYDKLAEDDPERRRFKENILHEMDELPRVRYHGRVGHQELAAAFLQSGFWLYPTYFNEISCITAMKAQAAGCWPVTTDLGALPETVLEGTRVSGDIHDPGVMEQWIQAVFHAVDTVTREDRDRMRKKALETFSWSSLAVQWDEKFKEWKRAGDGMDQS